HQPSPDRLISDTARLVPEGTSLVAVHAHGLNTDQVAQQIAASLDRKASTATTLLEDLDTTRPTRPCAVIIDAVDEAASAPTLLHSLLVPLARRHGLKVAIGARRRVLEDLGSADLIIDLDTDRYLDPQALVDYVRKLLLASPEPGTATPYHAEYVP